MKISTNQQKQQQQQQQQQQQKSTMLLSPSSDSPSLPSLACSGSTRSTFQSPTTAIVDEHRNPYQCWQSTTIEEEENAIRTSPAKSEPQSPPPVKEDPTMLLSVEDEIDTDTGLTKHIVFLKLLPRLDEEDDDELTTVDSYADADDLSISSEDDDSFPNTALLHEALSDSRIQAQLAERTALEMQQVMEWWDQDEPEKEQEEALPCNPLAASDLIIPTVAMTSLQQLPTISTPLKEPLQLSQPLPESLQLPESLSQLQQNETKPPHEEALEQCFLVDQIVERTQEMAHILEESKSHLVIDDDDEEVTTNQSPMLHTPQALWRVDLHLVFIRLFFAIILPLLVALYFSSITVEESCAATNIE